MLQDIAHIAVFIKDKDLRDVSFKHYELDDVDIKKDPATANICLENIELIIGNRNYAFEKPHNSGPRSLIIMEKNFPD